MSRTIPISQSSYLYSPQNMFSFLTEHLQLLTHMKTSLANISPGIHSRNPAFGCRVLGFFPVLFCYHQYGLNDNSISDEYRLPIGLTPASKVLDRSIPGPDGPRIHSGSCRWHLSRKTNRSETHVIFLLFCIPQQIFQLLFWLFLKGFSLFCVLDGTE